MTKKEKLYDRLGELNAEDIKWSFHYEVDKNSKVEDIYNKVIDFCKDYGPSPIYVEFIEAINTIANASDGKEKNETAIINSFSTDLIKKFKEDIETIK